MADIDAYDPDIVAYIFAAPGKFHGATTNVIESNLRLSGHSAREKDIWSDWAYNRDKYDQHQSRQWVADADDWKTGACYKIHFTAPNTSAGFIFGTNDKLADFLLPPNAAASAQHFALTFDVSNQLIVRDLGSTNGTIVIYGNPSAKDARQIVEVEGQGKSMDWSARGPSLTQGFHPIICIQNFQFRIVVPDHDIQSPEYHWKITQFRKGRLDPLVLFEAMKIQSRLHTAEATPARQPAQGEWWKKKLGQGSYGRVDYAWNVKTREVYAIKTRLRTGDMSPRESQNWKREAEIMDGLQHLHIIRLLEYKLTPTPKLIFEYAPCGTLQKYVRSSTSCENKQVAVQLLKALKFLHTRDRPIAHRDIKPGNVLVQSWTPSTVHVKLGDFGFAKPKEEIHNSELGTRGFYAPEIKVRPDNSTYDCKVDIWSLGALLLNMECHEMISTVDDSGNDILVMPEWGTLLIDFGEKYAKQQNETPVLDFALRYMLKIDPHERRPATECLSMATQEFAPEAAQDLTDVNVSQNAEASRLGEIGSSGGATVTQVRAHDDGATVVPRAQSEVLESRATVVKHPSTVIYHSTEAPVDDESRPRSKRPSSHVNDIASPPKSQANVVSEAELRPSVLGIPGSAPGMAIAQDLGNINTVQSGEDEKKAPSKSPGTVGQRKKRKIT